MNGDQALRAGGSLWMAGFIGGKMAFETGSNSYLQACAALQSRHCICICTSV